MGAKGEKITYNCEICSESVTKWWYPYQGERPKYCSWACKSEGQRRQKPVDRDWLYQKYIAEGLDCTQIGKLVNRDPKSVWNWLKDFAIPTRSRGGATAPGSFRKGERSAFAGHNHTPENKERVRQARLRDGRIPYLNKNGVHHLKGKRGPEVPSWKGGITPERQAFYSTPEWKAAVKTVYKRDNATCQRCGRRNNGATRGNFDIHHIVSFAVRELRCEVSNLVLLCEACHYWVHSNANTERVFINGARA